MTSVRQAARKSPPAGEAVAANQRGAWRDRSGQGRYGENAAADRSRSRPPPTAWSTPHRRLALMESIASSSRFVDDGAILGVVERFRRSPSCRCAKPSAARMDWLGGRQAAIAIFVHAVEPTAKASAFGLRRRSDNPAPRRLLLFRRPLPAAGRRCRRRAQRRAQAGGPARRQAVAIHGGKLTEGQRSAGSAPAPRTASIGTTSPSVRIGVEREQQRRRSSDRRYRPASSEEHRCSALAARGRLPPQPRRTGRPVMRADRRDDRAARLNRPAMRQASRGRLTPEGVNEVPVAIAGRLVRSSAASRRLRLCTTCMRRGTNQGGEGAGQVASAPAP